MLCPVNPTVQDTFQPIPDFNGCAMSHLPQAHVDTSNSRLVSKLSPNCKQLKLGWSLGMSLRVTTKVEDTHIIVL